mgnify:CR=1 FL=1
MSSFVTQIQTNIKSPDGDYYTVNIGKHTLLIGNNESGKSAIAEALQLARTGSAYGLLYRDKPIKDGKLLSALIPPSQDQAAATARFEDGSIREWVLHRGKRPKSSGAHEGQGTLSIAEMHSVMSGSTETKVKFFWEVLCEEITAADLMGLLPKDLHETLVLRLLLNLWAQFGLSERTNSEACGTVYKGPCFEIFFGLCIWTTKQIRCSRQGMCSRT